MGGLEELSKRASRKLLQMLAYHPVTGKEIRILQTDASLTKTQRTLQLSDTPRAGPWDTISDSGAARPTYLLCLDQFDEAAARAAKIVFVSKKALEAYTPESFKALGLTNVLVLEELHLMYPHLGTPCGAAGGTPCGAAWDGTRDGATKMVGDLLQYNRVVGPEARPAPLLWVTQYYVPSAAKRRREIQKCLILNSQSSLVERVVLLNEREESLPEGCKREKVEQRVIGKRLTYADVLRFAAELGATEPETLVAFANADIAIDSGSWRQLWTVVLKDACVALLRYDVPENGRVEEATLFGPRPDSQDTWVVRAGDVAKRATPGFANDSNVFSKFEFQFGQMGCDNAFALEMLRQKFLVVNPCLSLRTWHFHSSGVRTYDKNDVLERPFFHYVHPSGLQDVKPLTACPPGTTPVVPASLVRPVRGAGAATWMSEVNRSLPAGVEPFRLGAANPWTSAGPEFFVDGLRDVFMTSDGLVMDKEQLYIGPAATAQKVWAAARLQNLMPSVEVKKVLFAPWPAGAESSRETYVLKFLSKILRVAAMAKNGELAVSKAGQPTSNPKNGEMYCPDVKSIVEALHIFRWPEGKQPVIKHERDAQVWCREAAGCLISDVAETVSEDVAALRASLQGWVRTPQKCSGLLRLVIVEDGQILTTEFVRELEDVLERCFDVRVVYPGRTSAERMLDVMRGAWGVVSAGGLERVGWNWMLPEGAYAFEVVGAGQTASQEGLNLSAAAGLEHRFVRRAREELLDAILEEEKAWIASGGSSDDSDRPTIWLPRSDLEGYFSHPGDSFREMVRLWGAAGYVRVREHPTATMVWWGSLGGPDGVLLYDRPNHDWRLAAPMPERSWKFALFGNPKPPAAHLAPAKPWFFWPRRPSLVEELVAAGVPGASWEDRRAGLVFYGKVENKVQEKRRLGGTDWSTACTEFRLVRGDEPYPFTQKQVLEKLAGARFGLCLAGYGLKCHREIECMAMGCVPVCAPEVDMDSYAEPPVEGVHYLRVAGPDSAAATVASVSKVDWEKMSAACKTWWERNASCAGSFGLTKDLITGARGS